jgi:predicted GH43/DUF377 family glycosyl hydrolase
MRVFLVLLATASTFLGQLPVAVDAARADQPPMITWTRYSGNPVISTGDPGSWDSVLMYVDTVMQDNDGLKLYYTGMDAVTQGIGLATSVDGRFWSKSGANPVLRPGPSGSWDDKYVGGGSVLKDGTTYRMWYHGYDGTHWRLGYATSVDGTSWTKHEGNPVMDLGPDGSWDDNHVIQPYVMKDGGLYRMWYTGEDQVHMRIGYASSPDGITWTKSASNPLLDLGAAGSWDSHDVSTPSVVKDGDTYRLWYSGYTGMNWGIGCAFSGDGFAWTKYEANPVLARQPGWEAHDVILPTVLFNGTTYCMWYCGVDGSAVHKIGLAFGNLAPDAPSGLHPADDAWTGDAKPILHWVFSDPDPGNRQSAYELDVASDPLFHTLEYSSGKVASSATQCALSRPLEDGVYYWRVRAWDDSGGEGGWSVPGRFGIDTRPPGGVSISVNDGANITGNPKVHLRLDATDAEPSSGLGEMAFSEDGTVWSPWEPFNRSRDYLFGADGYRWLHLRVRDRALNIALPVSAGIMVDTRPPANPSITIEGGANATNNRTVRLRLDATDQSPSSGLEMAFSEDGRVWSPWEPFNQSRDYSFGSDGDKTLRFRVRDHAMNTALPASDSILVDSSLPRIISMTTTRVNKNNATLLVVTDEPCTVVIEYGTGRTYGQTVRTDSFAPDATVVIPQLKAGTNYHFRVSVTDRGGNPATVSEDQKFATKSDAKTPVGLGPLIGALAAGALLGLMRRRGPSRREGAGRLRSI